MFYINIDASELFSLDGMTEAAKKAMKEHGNKLCAMTRAHIIEEAGKKLHTRRQMFIDGVSTFQASDDTWVVNLDASVCWIDNGMPETNMLDALLKSKKAKRNKQGDTYVVVPFVHGPGKGATNTTPAQQTLLQTIKAELTKRQIPYGKIEKDDSGQAKIGRLHSFSITNAPIRENNRPGQGQGPVGKVMQGWARDGRAGIPLLQGVSVYQNKVKGKDGSEKVKRSIMTFRIASSKHKGEWGRWVHPGLPPVGIFEEAVEWATKQWETEIAPNVIGSFLASLS